MGLKEMIASANDVSSGALAPLSVAVISNISLYPFFSPLLVERFSKHQLICPDITYIPYEAYNAPAHQSAVAAAGMIVIWLHFESLFSDTSNSGGLTVNEVAALSGKLMADIEKCSNVKPLWFLFEDYDSRLPAVLGHTFPGKNLVNQINAELCETVNGGATYIDLKRLIAGIGIGNAYDAKGKYRWNAPYSQALIVSAVKEIHKMNPSERQKNNRGARRYAVYSRILPGSTKAGVPQACFLHI